MMPQLKRIFVGALILGVAVSFSAPGAFAQSTGDLRKCTKGYNKAGSKIVAAISKALAMCGDKARLNAATGKHVSASAAFCEKSLDKIYGNSTFDDTKTKVAKFFETIDKTRTVGTEQCTALQLGDMGHLIGGLTASAESDITDFSAMWLLKAKEMLAIKEVLFESVDIRALLTGMVNAGQDPVTLTNLGTDCTGTPPAGTAYRPNLCLFDPQIAPQCRTHACVLDSASSGAIHLAAGSPFPSLPLALGGNRLAVEICDVPGPLATTGPGIGVAGIPDDVTLSDQKMILTQPSKTVDVVSIPGVALVCLDFLRAQGWCDSDGGSPGLNISICTDHDIARTCATGICTDAIASAVDGDAFDDCGAPKTLASAESCGCFFGGGACNTTAAGCGACQQADDDTAPCHQGSSNGPPVPSFTGVAGANDCFDLNTISLTILTTSAQYGADATPCTDDDIEPPGSPTTIPFTTGSAISTIRDAVADQGHCVGGSNTSLNCSNDSDCTGPGSPTCGDNITNAFPDDENILSSYTRGATVLAGAGVPVPQLEASDMAGFTIIGGFPALDGPLILGDSVTAFTLICQ